MILCDVDHFKKFNDSFGHLEGDDCLKAVVICMKKMCKRSSDLVARYGGEEFAVVLPDTGIKGAGQLAQALCDEIASLEIKHPDSDHGVVTMSMSVYACKPDKDSGAESMLKYADEALYKAKESGRNKIQVYPV